MKRATDTDDYEEEEEDEQRSDDEEEENGSASDGENDNSSADENMPVGKKAKTAESEFVTHFISTFEALEFKEQEKVSKELKKYLKEWENNKEKIQLTKDMIEFLSDEVDPLMSGILKTVKLKSYEQSDSVGYRAAFETDWEMEYYQPDGTVFLQITHHWEGTDGGACWGKSDLWAPGARLEVRIGGDESFQSCVKEAELKAFVGKLKLPEGVTYEICKKFIFDVATFNFNWM